MAAHLVWGQGCNGVRRFESYRSDQFMVSDAEVVEAPGCGPGDLNSP